MTLSRAGRHQQSSAAQKEVILNDIVPSPHTQAAVFWLARADPIAEVNLDTILSSRVNRTTQRHIGYLGYSSVSPIDVSCLCWYSDIQEMYDSVQNGEGNT